MAIVDDLRKTLTDPTPLYAVAGTVDLTAEKLREVPALIEKLRVEAPERIAAARGGADPKVVQEKLTERAKELQAKFNDVVGSLDVKQFRDSAQDFALQQVGRAAEAAVKAREAYDELAERGRGVVSNLRGGVAEEVEDIAVAIEPSNPKPRNATPKAAGSRAGGSKTPGSKASTRTAGGRSAGAKSSAARTGTSRNTTARNASTRSAGAKGTTARNTTAKNATAKNASPRTTSAAEVKSTEVKATDAGPARTEESKTTRPATPKTAPDTKPATPGDTAPGAPTA